MRRAGAITPRPLRPVRGAESNTTASVCAVIVMAQAWALCLLAALPVPARFCDRVACLATAAALLTTAARTQIAADALGMDHSDPRGFTVTGGLPYYGQFACSAGALVRMVELLREDREAFGLVTGNGAQPDASACCLASK